MNNSEHYNHITEIWQYLMGTNFHWGLFEPEDISLEAATDRMIDKMLSLIHIQKGLQLLDVGCGIGGPAFYIANKHDILINGISNSQVGIEKANLHSREQGLSNRVKFFYRDALDNQFPDESMDVAWLLEMSHLLEDKKRLLCESTRVLKKGGELVLCDLILKKDLSFREIFENKADLMVLEGSFGRAQLRTIDYYLELFSSCGLRELKFIDVSKEVQQTLHYWEENALKFMMEPGMKNYSRDIENFIYSCKVLSGYYSVGKWGYAIIYGKKNDN